MRIDVYLLNWAVSQATNLVNNVFNMPEGSQHVGITMNGGGGGGGSGTHMADLVDLFHYESPKDLY